MAQVAKQPAPHTVKPPPQERCSPTQALPLLPLLCHPTRGSTVAWAAGRFLFAYDTAQSKWELSRNDAHQDTVRGLDALRGDGQITRWASGGDDKSVIVWSEENGAWTQTSKITHPKKVIAVLLDSEGRVVFADRFGDVYRWNGQESDGAEFLLGQLAIVTAMVFAGNGRFLVTADNHEKIRVSAYPNAFEIQSFCLGHTEQVTALAPIGELLLCSSAADKTIRLWNLEDGSQIASRDCGGAVSCLRADASGANLVLGVASGTAGLSRAKVGGVGPDALQHLDSTPMESSPQAVCFAAGSTDVLWVNRQGNLCIDGRIISCGDDVPPSLAALSKNANYLESKEGGEAGGDGDEA